jgi:hypothetical protein
MTIVYITISQQQEFFHQNSPIATSMKKVEFYNGRLWQKMSFFGCSNTYLAFLRHPAIRVDVKFGAKSKYFWCIKYQDVETHKITYIDV